MDGGIALLCTLHPASPDKQERILSLLRHSAREYYTLPSSKCTTWSYFAPLSPTKQPIITGLEIYTHKSALSAQVNDPVFFQPYHETVKRENLYAKPEELVAWSPAGGFVARKGEDGMSGNGSVVVSVSVLVCKSQRKVLELLCSFSDWVKENEPYVMTYTLFTRPKAENEVLLFVRYRDGEALKKHDRAPEHQDVVKKSLEELEPGKSTTTVWKEVEDSFASNVEGGEQQTRKGSRL